MPKRTTRYTREVTTDVLWRTLNFRHKKTTPKSNANQNEEPNEQADKKELETRKRKLQAYLNSQNKKCKLPLTASKKKGKSGDNNGTKVEHIKGSVEETKCD